MLKNWYKRLSLTQKIFLWMGIISIVLPIIWDIANSKPEITFNNNNSTFNEPVFQGNFEGSSISITKGNSIPEPKILINKIKTFQPYKMLSFNEITLEYEQNSIELNNIKKILEKESIQYSESSFYVTEIEVVVDSIHQIENVKLEIDSPTTIFSADISEKCENEDVCMSKIYGKYIDILSNPNYILIEDAFGTYILTLKTRDKTSFNVIPIII